MQMFYKLHSKNEQDIHLQRTIEIKEIMRKWKRTETEEKEKPKSKSVQYFLIVDRQRIQVCKTTFITFIVFLIKGLDRWLIC